MKKILIILILVIGLAISIMGCDGTKPILEVSYVEIITYPERYDGKELSVFGVLKKEEEGYCLYYSQYAAKYTYPIDSIWLGDLSKTATEQELKEWNTWYVEVTGTLDMEKRGPDDAYSSGIRVSSIKKVEIHEDMKHFEFLLYYDAEEEFN